MSSCSHVSTLSKAAGHRTVKTHGTRAPFQPTSDTLPTTPSPSSPFRTTPVHPPSPARHTAAHRRNAWQTGQPRSPPAAAPAHCRPRRCHRPRPAASLLPGGALAQSRCPLRPPHPAALIETGRSPPVVEVCRVGERVDGSSGLSAEASIRSVGRRRQVGSDHTACLASLRPKCPRGTLISGLCCDSGTPRSSSRRRVRERCVSASMSAACSSWRSFCRTMRASAMVGAAEETKVAV